MAIQIPPTFNQFIDAHPLLYRKLCFWADKRGIDHPSVQVQAYLTELIIEAKADCDNTERLIKWTKVLSHQERIAIAPLSPILIRDYAIDQQWYQSQKGEYSVMDEPVIREIAFDGKQQGVITRNRYNCLILNCDRLLIVDVDIAAPRGDEIQDCSKNCQIALTQKQAISALETLVEQAPKLGFRVYRTRNGLRYLCTTQPFDPLDSTTHRLMSNLYVDPLYARLCKFQATFRARLTPKPWRVGEGYTERFVYDRVTGLVLPESSPYSVCHLLEIIGETEILPEFEPLVQAHDAYCRVSRLGLELV